MTYNSLEFNISSKVSQRRLSSKIKAILPLLSLLIILTVFWWLKLNGITMAGDAFCGYEEHSHGEACCTETLVCFSEHEHTEDCFEKTLVCTLQEHTHTASCYSDINADLEDFESWEATLPAVSSKAPLSDRLVAIAVSQTGYTESELNFSVDNDGIRHGYTRYGEWYGNPYGDWSSMFVSFCLNYADIEKTIPSYYAGADTMAGEFEKLGRFAAASQYIPKAGDIVFFNNNTAAIIKDVSGNILYIIQGDFDNAVAERTLLISDETISGYGIITEKPPDDENSEVTEDTGGVPPDNPEAFTEAPDIIEEEIIIETENFNFDSQNVARIVDADLKEYLTANGGIFFFTLTDSENIELPKDADENYIASPDTEYKMTMTVRSPNGFAPGTYLYQLPDGLTINGGAGDFTLADGTNVGTWSVSDDGLMTFNLNQNINNRTNVTISATMGTSFSETLNYIDFDGKVIVQIEKPPEETKEIGLNKWGEQGDGSNRLPDPSKIYWTIEVFAPPGISPSGSTIRDNPDMGGHKYTESDMENGIYFGVSQRIPGTTDEVHWHEWTVYPGDPNLSWTEYGWVYHYPTVAPCRFCDNFSLTNNDYDTFYWIKYTTTPDPQSPGSAIYSNNVSTATKEQTGWVTFQHGTTTTGIIKEGNFVANADGGAFEWRIEATIPGMIPGEKAAYFWYLWDDLRVRNPDGSVAGYIDNDANLAKILMIKGGVVSEVPLVDDAVGTEELVWENTWSDYREGAAFGRQMDLFCKCNCNETNCQLWNNGGCDSRYWKNTDYCRCWTFEQDTQLILTYETDISVIERFGGLGHYLINSVQLNNKKRDDNGNWMYSSQADSNDTIMIPGYFSKELTKDFDGYVANYTITVNEAMLPLTNGTPVTIHDMMTDTLAYISGSLVITWVDADGNTGELEEEVDYTVTYDGTGNQTDKDGNKAHVLDVVILDPRSVTYILNYDTTLIIPDDITEGIKYKNSATVELWGQELTVDTEEKIHADINISAHIYKLAIEKCDSQSKLPLKGAVFGMYNDHGGHITTGETDANGHLPFETDIINGIVLRDHVLYYVQELEAPEGYRLDDTKYWFCFCDSEATTCTTCDAIIGNTGAFRIPYEQIGTVEIENILGAYELPATGGLGAYRYYILWGAVLITVPVVYRYVWRRKRERRLE